MSRILLAGFLSVFVFASGCGSGDSKKEEADKAGADQNAQSPKLKGALNTPSAANNPILRSKSRAEQMILQNNLKMVILAMHNYHDTHRSLPPGGEGKLSWRVRILPFIEQNALYNQFKLDEPWDSEHNKKLIDKMPEVYKTTSADDLTSLMVCVGDGALYDGGKPTTLSRITDGSSNTLAVVVAGGDKAVPWTKPVDVRFNPSDPYSELGDIGDTLVYATVDGSVFRRSKSSIPAETLKALITKSGGEVINLR
jgi:hypothetical protein